MSTAPRGKAPCNTRRNFNFAPDSTGNPGQSSGHRKQNIRVRHASQAENEAQREREREAFDNKLYLEYEKPEPDQTAFARRDRLEAATMNYMDGGPKRLLGMLRRLEAMYADDRPAVAA
jgi:hypothetical protein